MKNSLLTVFISLLTGVSCSLNPKTIPKQSETFTKKPVEEQDRDDKKVFKKKKLITKKENKKNNTHPELTNTLRKKKISTKNQPLKSPEKESKEQISQEKNNEELTKIIKVHGMVCAFCSNSIEKKFKKQKTVKSIKVDLESKKVTLVLKAGEIFPDEEIKKLIKASGFQPVSIENKRINSKQDSER